MSIIPNVPQVVSVRGPMGTGKSTLAMEWRGRNSSKWWGDFEMGAMRALIRFPEWKQYVSIYHPFRSGSPEAVNVLIDNLTSARGELLAGRDTYYRLITEEIVKACGLDYKVLIFDTWKHLWTANHQMHLQKLQEEALNDHRRPRQNLMPIEYATPNARQENIPLVVKGYGKDLVLVSHERPARISHIDPETSRAEMIEDPSGRRELDGYKSTLDLADWSFVTSVVSEGDGYHFLYKIEKSPFGVALIDKVIKDFTWKKLENLVEGIMR